VLGESTPGRVAITAGIVALAALVGLLTARATSDEPAAAPPPAQSAPAPAPAYEDEIGDRLEQLATARAAQLRRLRAASTPAEQAQLSRAIAGAYREAAGPTAQAAARANAPPSLQRLAEALEAAAAAYDRLARAAARDSRPAYDKAREAVRSSEVGLARELEASLDPSSS
jgi:hypothetical protein